MIQNKLWKIIVLCCLASNLMGQRYTSYFTGDSNDVSPPVTFGICMMGGAGEHDEAMRWFLERSGGGDIVVIRVTGADGYNNYFYNELGVDINSVETLLVRNTSDANDPYIRQQLRNAEAIWIAGGDQYDYVSFWKNSAVDSAINDLANVKKGPVGGTSAGMAILGGHYFTASHGTISSSQALNNPFHSRMRLEHNDFLHLPFLEDLITDTHYDSPNRKGRHFAFLARITNDFWIRSFGIACDEYTAVCIDSTGKARVFGEYPSYNDNAYFLQANCIEPFIPEVCEESTPLTWDRNNQAVKVYAVKGDWNGTNYLELSDWETGSGGVWEDWWVTEGQMFIQDGDPPNCNDTTVLKEHGLSEINVFPVPSSGNVYLRGLNPGTTYEINIYNINGISVKTGLVSLHPDPIDGSGLPDGLYFVRCTSKEGAFTFKMQIVK